MSAVKVVEVLCLNGRRQKVKTTPSTTILQVLQEVCKKQGFDAVDIDLVHQRKILDVSATMRFTNIPNNGKLEMLKRTVPRKASNVNVAIQTDFGERLQHQFSPDSTLLQILKHWDGNPESVYHGKIICKMPSLMYMTHEICGIANLNDTTLTSLGLIGGNAVFRLSHKDEEKSRIHLVDEPCDAGARQVKPLEGEKRDAEKQLGFNKDGDTEMKSENSSPVKEKSAESTSEKEGNIEPLQKRPKLPDQSAEDRNFQKQLVEDIVTNDDIQRVTQNVRPFQEFKFPEVSAERIDEVQAIDPKQILTEERLSIPCNRKALVFDLNRIELANKQHSEPDDNFFDLTIEDLRKRINSLKANASEEAPLITKGMRNAKDMEKAFRYKQVIIRVQFPDKHVLQGIFRPLEKIRAVKDFIRENLQNSDDRFYIYTTPPKNILKQDDQTLHQAKLIPTALLHVAAEPQSRFALKKEVLGNIKTYLEAEKIAYDVLKSHVKHATDLSSSERFEDPQVAETISNERQERRKPATSDVMTSKTTSNPERKVPKWFR